MKLRNILFAALCVIALSFTSCNDWLEASSKTQVQLEDQFKNEAGFKDALIGIYLEMADGDLYGMNLTWRFAEILSMVYATQSGHPDAQLWTYNYKYYNHYETIYLKLYHAIAGCNNIIRMAEAKPGVMNPLLDSCIRGEAYALRAMLHLDVLRFYGKGNLLGRNLYSEKALPYITTYSKEVTPKATYDEYLACIEKDCLKAIELLEADPQKNQYDRADDYYDIISDDNFISMYETQRKNRMNYYAACGVLARAMMWDGRPEARKKAQQWAAHAIGVDRFGDDPIDDPSDGEGPAWWWATISMSSSTPWSCDKSFCYYEPLFHIYCNLTDLQKYSGNSGGFFDPWSPNSTYGVLYFVPSMNEEVFELESKGVTEDWRRKFVTLVGSNYSIYKYRQIDRESGKQGKELFSNIYYYDRMALIRPTEMMYILAECAMKDGNMAKCAQYLNSVRHWRNISESHDIPSNLNAVEMETEIMKEYRRDLLCEGQLFLYYKRQGYSHIYGYAQEMTDTEYVVPLPEDEEILANL